MEEEAELLDWVGSLSYERLLLQTAWPLLPTAWPSLELPSSAVEREAESIVDLVRSLSSEQNIRSLPLSLARALSDCMYVCVYVYTERQTNKQTDRQRWRERAPAIYI